MGKFTLQKKKIKKVIKKWIEYTIEDDMRIYRVRHTGIRFRVPLVKKFEQQYGALPIVPGKIVVDNYMGHGYGCNSKYVTEALRKSGRPYDIVWTVKNAAEHEKEFPEGVRLVEYGTKEALYEYATAQVWLCNYHLIFYWNKGLQKKPGQFYIQMWHGSFGIKKIENDCGILTNSKSWLYLAQKNSKNTDLWVSNSAFETEVYRRAFWDVTNVKEWGHPRNDLFFSSGKERASERVNAYLGIDAAEKLFLYVPTFREKGKSTVTQLNVAAVCAALRERTGENWKFAVRFHPQMKAAERASFLECWEHVRDVTDYPDVQELLVRADAAMTDYSSCIFDYLLTEKPGFLFVPDRAAYHEERGFYYRLEESPFPVAETNEALCENIRTFDEAAYRKKVTVFLQGKGSVEDGHAAERIAAAIDKIIKHKNAV